MKYISVRDIKNDLLSSYATGIRMYEMIYNEFEDPITRYLSVNAITDLSDRFDAVEEHFLHIDESDLTITTTETIETDMIADVDEKLVKLQSDIDNLIASKENKSSREKAIIDTEIAGLKSDQMVLLTTKKYTTTVKEKTINPLQLREEAYNKYRDKRGTFQEEAARNILADIDHWLWNREYMIILPSMHLQHHVNIKIKSAISIWNSYHGNFMNRYPKDDVYDYVLTLFSKEGKDKSKEIINNINERYREESERAAGHIADLLDKIGIGVGGKAQSLIAGFLSREVLKITQRLGEKFRDWMDIRGQLSFGDNAGLNRHFKSFAKDPKKRIGDDHREDMPPEDEVPSDEHSIFQDIYNVLLYSDRLRTPVITDAMVEEHLHASLYDQLADLIGIKTNLDSTIEFNEKVIKRSEGMFSSDALSMSKNVENFMKLKDIGAKEIPDLVIDNIDDIVELFKKENRKKLVENLQKGFVGWLGGRTVGKLSSIVDANAPDGYDAEGHNIHDAIQKVSENTVSQYVTVETEPKQLAENKIDPPIPVSLGSTSIKSIFSSLASSIYKNIKKAITRRKEEARDAEIEELKAPLESGTEVDAPIEEQSEETAIV